MKAAVCARIRVAAVVMAAALLTMAPVRPAHAQADSTVVPSSHGADASAPLSGETGKSADSGEAATHHQRAHDHTKKKKPSFMHKMRDKAMAKVQKLFGSKLEPQQEPKQVPKQDIE